MTNHKDWVDVNFQGVEGMLMFQYIHYSYQGPGLIQENLVRWEFWTSKGSLNHREAGWHHEGECGGKAERHRTQGAKSMQRWWSDFKLGGWFQIFFMFTPNLGEMIQFDYIFFKKIGWNHQRVNEFKHYSAWQCDSTCTGIHHGSRMAGTVINPVYAN